MWFVILLLHPPGSSMRAQYNDTSALHNVISVLLCSVDLISLRQTSSGLPPDIPCPVNALQVGYRQCRDVTWRDVTLRDVTLRDVTLCYVTLRDVVRAVTSRYVMWCCCDVTLCDVVIVVTLRDVVIVVTSSYVMWWLLWSYVMLRDKCCNVTLCYLESAVTRLD